MKTIGKEGMERMDHQTRLLELGLICEKCSCETEIIVEREFEGKIVRFGKGCFTTMKPTHRGRFCYYHRKKEKGKFEPAHRVFPRMVSVFDKIRR